MNFAETLREIRKAQGHEKARGFHHELAKKGVECNYAYYMKMEAGQVLPSAKIIEQISETLSDEFAKELILSYCRTLFPRYSHFFPLTDTVNVREKEAPRIDISQAPGRELTRRQVAVLGHSKAHYHVFLVSTIARRPLQMSELKAIFPNQKSLPDVVAELEAAQIVRVNREGVKAIASEHKFPSEKEFPELKPTYRQFDEWDETFAEDMNFSEHQNKMIIRRISPRYLDVIEDSLNNILKIIRAADELDTKYNESLIQVRLSLKSGKIPG